MIIKELNIKGGSIMLYKKYGWLKKLWYNKIRKRELPYNDFTIFGNTIGIVSIEGLCGVVAEPVKKYSNKELSLLEDLLASSNDINTVDLFTVINVVRPSTFEDKESDLSKLLTSKYYKVRELANEAEYN